MNSGDAMNNRNVYFDYLKIICTFLVVYIHAGLDTGIISSISMVAVPVFFIISGYLYQAVTVRKGKLKKQIIRISKLFLLSFIFYIAWSGVALPLLKGEAVALSKQLSVVAVTKLVLVNAPTYGYHLWYLAALVYVLVIDTAIDKADSENLRKFADMCSLFLLVASTIVPMICAAFNLPYRIEIVRNFLFEGYPMFHIGRIIAKRITESEVSVTVPDANKEVSVKSAHDVAWFAITLCLLIGLLIEQRIYDAFEITSALSVFTVLLAVALVLWAVYLNTMCEFRYGSEREDNIQRKQAVSPLKLSGGGVFSTGIYIIHVFVLSIINYLDFLEDGLLKTVLCFCISALLVAIWEQTNSILRKRTATLKIGESSEKS